MSKLGQDQEDPCPMAKEDWEGTVGNLYSVV